MAFGDERDHYVFNNAGRHRAGPADKCIDAAPEQQALAIRQRVERLLRIHVVRIHTAEI